MRVVGKRTVYPTQISIEPTRGGRRLPSGQYRRTGLAPYCPKTAGEAYSFGGNSLCYALQTAKILGCNRAYLLGFTLANGAGYFFGAENPVTRKKTFYDADVPMEWCRWFASRYPGYARLLPGFGGPIEDIFEHATLDELPWPTD